MKIIFSLFLLISLFGSSKCLECKGKPDGFYEVSCLSMVKCTAGKLERIMCPQGQVVDTADHQCKDMVQVKPPCGKAINCSNMNDGSYADVDQKCLSYFTCLGGHFLGHTLCPAGLVFNSELNLCDFKDNVPKPCGNKAN